MGEWEHKDWSVSEKFEIITPRSATPFLELGARFSSSVATKAFFGGRKCKHLTFLGYFSEAKTEECNQKTWIVYNRFGIITRYSLTYFLEVGTRVSLNVVTKDF